MISYVDQETIEIFGGAGTGVWFCEYDDIVHDRFSEPFACPAAAKYQKVAFPEFREEESVLVIRDMFDAENCYQEFLLDFGKVVTPVLSAEFKSEDTLLVTYESGEFYGDQEKTKLLSWGESGENPHLAEEIPVCDIVRTMDFIVKEPRLDITPEESCYFNAIVGVGLIWRHDGLHADVSEKEWKEITAPFFEMVENFQYDETFR